MKKVLSQTKMIATILVPSVLIMASTSLTTNSFANAQLASEQPVAGPLAYLYLGSKSK